MTKTAVLSRFVDEESREEFLARYGEAMGAWPQDRVESDVDTRFGSTHVHRHGDGDGIPVVLLHGGNTTPAAWHPTVAALAEGRAVYAVDVLGEPGMSTQTAPMIKSADTAEWLTAVLDGLGLERVHLIGMSYGGWIAANQALHTPGRLASITLIEPSRVLAELRPVFAVRTLWNHLLRVESLWREYLEWCSRTSPAVRDLQVMGSMRFRKRLMPPRKLGKKQLAGITVPTLVLLGATSPVLRVQRAAGRASLIPNAEVVVIPGAGHALPSEQPDAVNTRITEFLARH
ncbi:alpha/beta fold hydrolase [Allokutzneria albata]|uniref:Pimeloyl-ACP methyl ester carboxylesterase n=1 Tax=Allokutzneria albata TaxID=211114 RepID=A0A1G9R2M7_ALLAB|nr:alpha/beta hydrolase [Allokutzneria albata]SDM17552.1 Pimeloyl-ACP methyl ester carboxylesterase [Allokutzneria albata]